MEILVKKAENGWIVKRKNRYREDGEPLYTEFVCVTDDYSSDANDEIAELLHQVMYAAECDCGKRNMKNIHIALLPGYDCGPMQDDKQIRAATELANRLLHSLGGLEAIPDTDGYDDVPAIRAAVAAFKKALAEEEKKAVAVAKTVKKKKVI